jgi:predicted  nucleic acid-binding Zn-ribbon protein/molybdopterin converting factor small subunit
MKKSLLKRAVSAAVSLPLALTQCVLPAIAAEPAVNNAETKTLTIDTFTNVDVASEWKIDNGVYTQESTWAETLSGAFLANDGAGFAVEQEKLDSMFANVINNAGAYAKEAEMILNNIKDVNAVVESDGKIVFSATLEDISGSIEELCEEEVNKAIDELKAKYGEEYTGKLDDFSFDCPAIAGKIDVTIDMSNVAADKGGKVTYSFTADGKTYTGMKSIKGYVNEKFEAIKAEINKEIDKLLVDAKTELDFAQMQVDDAQALLDAKKIELANAEKELNIRKAELAQAKADAEDAQKKLDEAAAGVDTSEEQAKLDKAMADIASADKRIAEVEADILMYKEQAVDAQNTLDDANAKLDQAEADFEKAGGTASDKVDAYFAGLESKLDKITEKGDELLALNKTVTAVSVNEILAKFSTDINAVVNNETANSLFNAVIDKINSLAADTDYAVAITLADVGEVAEGLEDIVVSYEGGIATFTATFEDDQFEELVDEYEDVLDITESCKKIEATADIKGMYEGNGSFSLNIIREFKATEMEPETTTTTTPVVTTTPADTTTTPADTTTTPADTTTTPADTTTTPADTTTTPGGTTTTPITTTLPKFEFKDCLIDSSNGIDGFEAVEGYYFSHDTNTFNKNQITKLVVTVIGKDDRQIAGVNLLDEAEMIEKLGGVIDIHYGNATPNSTFDADKGNKYDIAVHVNNIALSDENYVPCTVTAYIGVKGDVDLDNQVNAYDSSATLKYYAALQTGVENPVMYSAENQSLENFTCFLGDVDEDEYAENNWKKTEAERNTAKSVNALDASYMLAYYAHVQTGSAADNALWDKVLPSAKAE